VRTVRSIPAPLPAAARDIWTSGERRDFGRKLDTARPADGGVIIEEMTRELERLTAHAADVERNIARWEQERRRIAAAQADWGERAALAVDKGRDELARAAIAQQHKLDARRTRISDDLARLETLLATYYRDIAALEEKASDSIRLAVVAASRLEGAEDSRRARELIHGERTAAAMSDLDAFERAADAAEGEAEALALGGPAPTERDLAALEEADRLDRALADLKSRRRSAA